MMPATRLRVRRIYGRNRPLSTAVTSGYVATDGAANVTVPRARATYIVSSVKALRTLTSGNKPCRFDSSPQRPPHYAYAQRTTQSLPRRDCKFLLLVLMRSKTGVEVSAGRTGLLISRLIQRRRFRAGQSWEYPRRLHPLTKPCGIDRLLK